MPRIYNSASEPTDFCRRHMPPERRAELYFGNIRRWGEGPDGRGNCYSYDAEHPPYDGEDYRCNTCKKTLTSEDD